MRKDLVPRVASALLYIVSRQSHIPIPLEKMVTEEVSKSEISEALSKVSYALQIKIPRTTLPELTLSYSKRFDLKPETKGLARKLAKLVEDDSRSIGKDPNGLAAASLYLAAKKNDEPITKEELKEISYVTPVTIRNSGKLVKEVVARRT